MTNVKKQKISDKQHSSSKIFSAFRTIGLVTDGTRFAVTNLGQTFLITTVVGQAFNIYDAATLQLLFVSSPLAPSKFTCVYSHFHHVFGAWGHSVGVYKRGKLQFIIEIPANEEDTITDILLFGDYLCVSTDSTVHVFKINLKESQYEPYTSYKAPSVAGPIKQVLHLPTYLNKIIIVTDHLLLIFNVRAGKLIYTSDRFGDDTISSVEPAPVLDVVAASTLSGDVHLYNIKTDKVLFTLNTGVRITSLSFRTDGNPQLAIGSFDGDIFFYDLNNRRRIHSARSIHSNSITGVSNVHFLNGQPIVVSNGSDNLLNEMVFDPAITTNKSITSPPRFLRSRGGHSLPPNIIEFTDEEAHFILSGSQDRSLWSFSLRKDSQSHEFSQRTSTNPKNQPLEKFSEITALAYQADKQNRWNNIITAHKDETYARTWSGKRGIVGKNLLKTNDSSTVKSVSISACGNFGLIGSSSGGIAVYNMQSGEIRKNIQKAHEKSITGIAMNSLNTFIISCSLDGTVKFHEFSTGELLDSLHLGASITQMRLQQRSGLLALALDDLSIVVLDINTRKTVRVLVGHFNRITSFDFTPDGRWIISSSLDKTIRTWDLPAGGCIDAVKVDKVVTCLRISPNGEWIATCHVQGVGIQLWTQKAQFSKMLSLRLISDEEIQNIAMPNAAGENGSNVLDGALDEDVEQIIEGTGPLTAMDQLDKNLISLSLQPRSKFNTLVHLETIKERNKPREAPKKPEKAPFFLTKAPENDEKPKENGKTPNATTDLLRQSEFSNLLKQNDSVGIVEYLKSLSPAMTDIEIRTLETRPPYTELRSFIQALTDRLAMKKDYEMVQAWMSMVLRIHGDILATEEGDQLRTALSVFTTNQITQTDHLDHLSSYCSGVLNFLKAA